MSDGRPFKAFLNLECSPNVPFEYDIEKQNLLSGNTLKAFALYGLGQYSEAELCIRRAAELDPNDFTIYAYRQVTKQ